MLSNLDLLMAAACDHAATRHISWNKGKLVGQKAPLKLKEIRAIRVRLQLGNRTRELALFTVAIDSKLRSCDLVKLRVRDVCHGNVVAARAIVMQQKTQRPVQFEITEQTRESLLAWIRAARLRPDDYLFPSRIHGSTHLSTRQYSRIVRGWVQEIGLDSSAYGTHTMRRTKASLTMSNLTYWLLCQKRTQGATMGHELNQLDDGQSPQDRWRGRTK